MSRQFGPLVQAISQSLGAKRTTACLSPAKGGINSRRGGIQSRAERGTLGPRLLAPAQLNGYRKVRSGLWGRTESALSISGETGYS